jgi:pimeloyl-ACP methyl ester carboxylesterase
MKIKSIIIFITISLSIFSTYSFADELQGDGVPDNAYLDGGQSEVAVILCHGRGQHPTWDVVNPLRKGIHEELGYHTISIQMPAPGGNWRGYEEYFPEAYQRIAATVKAIKARGINKIYLMGHSMGSRMATAYLAYTNDHGIDGFIGVGVRNAKFGGPMDSYSNLESANIPTVDIYGDGGDGKDEKHASRREDLLSDTYTQVLIDGADHLFNGDEDKLVKATVDWLRSQN